MSKSRVKRDTILYLHQDPSAASGWEANKDTKATPFGTVWVVNLTKGTVKRATLAQPEPVLTVTK